MSRAKQMPLGTRIRWARSRKHLSHDQLAARAGTSRSHLIKIEKGMHRPGPELVARIAVATEQPVDFFKDEEDEEEADLVRDLAVVLRRLIAHEATREVQA